MAKSNTVRPEIVPIGQKIAFGSGHLANQLYPAALSVFMVVLVLSLKMDPFLAGLLASLPRIIDAITDPIMGFISDNTKSRYGRRKPYILVGAIISGLSYMVMWQLDPANTEAYNFFYFLSFSIIFYLGYTIFATPLIGLGYEMSSDYNERTRLMAVSQFMGQMAWVIAPWFWIIIYDQRFYESAPVGARSLALWIGALCIFLGIIPAIFCKEIEVADRKLMNLSIKNLGENFREFFRSIVQAFKNGPFVKLCSATFLVFNGFQTIAQFGWFIIVFYLFNGSTSAAGTWPAWFGTLTALCTMFLTIPAVTYLSAKYEKRTTFIISTVVSMIGYGLKWWTFDPSNPYLMFIPLPLISFGIGGLFTLMMSMTADVCDLDELRNGKRQEGLFGAVYWWMVKLGTAIAFLISGAILSLIGFDADAPNQTVQTITNLRIADIVVPIIAGGFAIWSMIKYPISEKRANEIREELMVQRQGKL